MSAFAHDCPKEGLFAEFECRTINYGTSFIPPNSSACAWAVSVFVWTLVLAACVSLFMVSGACAYVSQCLYRLWFLRFTVFVWTLRLTLAFL